MTSRTIKSLLLTALCILTASPSMQADFWKSLKKAAKTGQEVLDQLSGPQNNQSKSNKTGTNTLSTSSDLGIMPGLDIKLLSSERWGKDVRIIYSVTNNTAQERTLIFHIACAHMGPATYDPIILDDDNNKYKGGPTSLGDNTFSFDRGTLYATIPEGITVKGIYTIGEVPRNVNNFKVLTFGLQDRISGRDIPYQYVWNNVPVTQRKNTNGDNIICTLPTLDINYQNLEPAGRDMSLNFTLTNNTGADFYPWAQIVSNGSTSAYSYDGDTFETEWRIGGKDVHYSPDGIPAGVTVKCSLLIKDVPIDVTGFSLVRCTFGSKYKIEFKNIDVSE